MAAATHTLDRANKASTYERFKRVARRLLGKAETDGLFYVIDSGSFTPTSVMTDDADDLILCIQFPEGAKLYDLQIVSTADVDTGSGALVYDVTAFDGSSTHVTLISGCTIGATGSGKDEMTRDQGNMFLDVGGDYLCLKITTPANANAGTGALRVKAMVFQGDLINVSA